MHSFYYTVTFSPTTGDATCSFTAQMGLPKDKNPYELKDEDWLARLQVQKSLQLDPTAWYVEEWLAETDNPFITKD